MTDTTVEPPDAADRVNEAQAQSAALGLTELTTSEVPVEVQTWLARLALLYGVPFEHLVPDATMLPPESIRFFHIDANWLEAMVDGAFSIGVHSQRDIRFHRELHVAVREATAVAAGKLRRVLRGNDAESDSAVASVGTEDDRVRGGFLMRSEIVAGWPGLEVTGYVGPEKSTDAIRLLRLDRLAPDLLLCVFDTIPGLIVINEPRESLHFGLDNDAIETRPFGDVDDQAATPGPGTIAVPWRGDADDRRINFNVLAQRLADDDLVEWGLDGRVFGPGDLAAQLVDPPGEQYFIPAPEDDE